MKVTFTLETKSGKISFETEKQSIQSAKASAQFIFDTLKELTSVSYNGGWFCGVLQRTVK